MDLMVDPLMVMDLLVDMEDTSMVALSHFTK